MPKMKVTVTMTLVAEREFTEEELADLYPQTMLQDDLRSIVQLTETKECAADPAQYAGILLEQGAKLTLRTWVRGSDD